MLVKKIRKIISIALSMLFMLSMLPTIHVHADYTGECGDGVYYSFDESSGTLTISGNGKMRDYNDRDKKVPWYHYKFNIRSVKIENGVEYIGMAAFLDCSSLIKVDIPSSVTEIGPWAFLNCTNLDSVTLGTGLKKINNNTFSGSSLTSIDVNENNEDYKSIDGVLFSKDGEKLIKYPPKKEDATYIIPNEVTEISVLAFSGCRNNLANVTLGTALKKIELWAFSGCMRLTAINVNENNENYKSIDGVLFSKDGKELIQYPPNKKDTNYIIPNDVTKIADQAFSDCANLESVFIPGSVSKIGELAFERCHNLTSVNISEGVQCIGEGAFTDCTKLSSIVIPNSVTGIEWWTFDGCQNLAHITFGTGLKKIGFRAFSNCIGLTAINVNENNEDYKSIDGVLFSKDGKELIKYPAKKEGINYDIPNNVTNIADYAFENCENLESVSIPIPGSVSKIGEYAFRNCKKLSSIVIPDSVADIGNRAFSECENLTLVEINNSINIEDSVFHGCPSSLLVLMPKRP